MKTWILRILSDGAVVYQEKNSDFLFPAQQILLFDIFFLSLTIKESQGTIW